MFKLSVLTPEKKVIFEQEITEVTVPVRSGEVQILPGHVPMIANLGTGILKFKVAGSVTENRYVISWGYCEVHAGGVNVLAEFIQAPLEVDEAKARAIIAVNQSKLLTENLSDPEFETAVNSIEKSESAIRLVH